MSGSREPPPNPSPESPAPEPAAETTGETPAAASSAPPAAGVPISAAPAASSPTLASSSGSFPSAPLQYRLAAKTDIGLVRESNEDSILIGDLDLARPVELDGGAPLPGARGTRGPLLVVCDGMGGVAGGEVASELGVRITWREMSGTPATGDPEVFARLLRRAVRIANAEIHSVGRRDAGLRGMGTTLTAAAVAGSRLVVATVGDSRAYVLRGDRLVQVSRDQSLASALVDAGHPVDAVEAHGAILQALGVTPDCEPSLSIIDLRRGDRVLLCSDGLYNLLGEGALGTILGDERGPHDAVRLLVEGARAAGGNDNISALVLEVDGDRFLAPGDGELPRFREFDPQREGDPALTSTSHVARRLAARIGLATDDSRAAIPVTGQHMIPQRVARRSLVAPELEESPARARLASRSASLAILVIAAAAALGALGVWLLR